VIDQDPELARDIVEYLAGQAPDESVKRVELIKREFIAGAPYDVWDVATNQNEWWVITNPTNLYIKEHFKSLDYTLSFHVGLMMRVASRADGATAHDPHPFDEVFRRQEQAKDRHDRAIEAEDFQAVGVLLRECLLSLSSALQRRMEISEDRESPRVADFLAWSEVVLDEVCPGQSNKQLRKHMKAVARETWQLVNWLTHDKDAQKSSSFIAIQACDMVVGHFTYLFWRDRIDKFDSCPHCSSRDVRSHFDIGIGPDGDYYSSCGSCGWNSHPNG